MIQPLHSYRGTRVAPLSETEGTMIWIGLVAMGVVAFGYMKIRRQRKASATH
jgi:hypothetical protein